MSNNSKNHILKDVYTLNANLWCSPQDVDMEEVKKDADAVIKRLEIMKKVLPNGKDLGGAALLLSGFLRENAISEEDYIELFELEPKCPLYLGSHSYDEPKTCANAAVSDRNEYMIELLGIYKHFGQALDGKELPDYLPLMVDFLALTAQSNNDQVREKFIKEYFLPYLPPLRKRLEELKTPYLHLLDALEKVINYELKTQPVLMTN